MGLLDGLEIFGMDGSNMDDLFSDQKKQPTVQRTAAPVVHKETETKEEDQKKKKKTVCPVCDHEFKTLTPKSGRVRRKESDRDLRPRSVGIDTLKYNVICCPMCGYAGLTQNDWFQNILRPQKPMIRAQVTSKFDPLSVRAAYGADVRKWSYELSIALHKLSLFNSMVKNAKASEKAYNCLVLSWLHRGWGEELREHGAEEGMQAKVRAVEEDYYKKAYEGLTKAMATETPPVCGMSEHMLSYLVAVMSQKFGKLEIASKLVATILVSQTAEGKIKDRARDLKEELITQIKERRQM